LAVPGRDDQDGAEEAEQEAGGAFARDGRFGAGGEGDREREQRCGGVQGAGNRGVDAFLAPADGRL
jgi:hypothetical protein